MRLLLIAVVSAALAPFHLAPETQQGSHAHGFAPFPEVTVRGTVDAVLDEGSEACTACEACSDCRGTHIVLLTGSDRVEVHLAPAWFLQLQEYTVLPGNVVSVTGTRMKMPKGRGIVARELRRGDTLMKLRDEHGLPLWRRVLTDDGEQ